MTATYELEPCPCCGGEARLKDVQGAKIRQGWVGCPACHLYINWKISPAAAIRTWNARAGLTVEKALAAVESIYVLAPDEAEAVAEALRRCV